MILSVVDFQNASYDVLALILQTSERLHASSRAQQARRLPGKHPKKQARDLKVWRLSHSLLPQEPAEDANP